MSILYKNQQQNNANGTYIAKNQIKTEIIQEQQNNPNFTQPLRQNFKIVKSNYRLYLSILML